MGEEFGFGSVMGSVGSLRSSDSFVSLAAVMVSEPSGTVLDRESSHSNSGVAPPPAVKLAKRVQVPLASVAGVSSLVRRLLRRAGLLTCSARSLCAVAQPLAGGPEHTAWLLAADAKKAPFPQDSSDPSGEVGSPTGTHANGNSSSSGGRGRGNGSVKGSTAAAALDSARVSMASAMSAGTGSGATGRQSSSVEGSLKADLGPGGISRGTAFMQQVLDDLVGGLPGKASFGHSLDGADTTALDARTTPPGLQPRASALLTLPGAVETAPPTVPALRETVLPASASVAPAAPALASLDTEPLEEALLELASLAPTPRVSGYLLQALPEPASLALLEPGPAAPAPPASSFETALLPEALLRLASLKPESLQPALLAQVLQEPPLPAPVSIEPSALTTDTLEPGLLPSVMLEDPAALAQSPITQHEPALTASERIEPARLVAQPPLEPATTTPGLLEPAQLLPAPLESTGSSLQESALGLQTLQQPGLTAAPVLEPALLEPALLEPAPLPPALHEPPAQDPLEPALLTPALLDPALLALLEPVLLSLAPQPPPAPGPAEPAPPSPPPQATPPAAAKPTLPTEQDSPLLSQLEEATVQAAAPPPCDSALPPRPAEMSPPESRAPHADPGIPGSQGPGPGDTSTGRAAVTASEPATDSLSLAAPQVLETPAAPPPEPAPVDQGAGPVAEATNGSSLGPSIHRSDPGSSSNRWAFPEATAAGAPQAPAPPSNGLTGKQPCTSVAHLPPSASRRPGPVSEAKDRRKSLLAPTSWAAAFSEAGGTDSLMANALANAASTAGSGELVGRNAPGTAVGGRRRSMLGPSPTAMTRVGSASSATNLASMMSTATDPMAMAYDAVWDWLPEELQNMMK